MEKRDVIVVGAGISGLAFAYYAARAGRSVLVLERGERLGGCLSTHRLASGYWFELGAHTCYNSYVRLAEIVEGCGLRGEVLRRARTHLRFFEGDELVPGSNLRALVRLISFGELIRSAPRMVAAKKDGHTVYSYYSRMVGRRNYGNVFGPLFAAVPSQGADAFPAGMLMKSRRTRRRDFPRSFTLGQGLQTLVDGIARQPRIEVRLSSSVSSVEWTGGEYAVLAQGGEDCGAPVVAVATSPSVASRILRGVAPELATQAARVKESVVETLGFVVRAEKLRLPVSTFLIPRDDLFHSVVTRDSVPDPAWRGFAFHFRPGQPLEKKIERVTRLLGIARGDLEDLAEESALLPSPVLGHEHVVREIDRLSSGARLCLTGNWFAGLSIEDCVSRSREEWERAARLATLP